MNILEIKNVCKNYKAEKGINTKVLKNINLTVKDNEFVGIMGSSGSGKTTLLNVAAGIDSFDDGKINICGNDISKMKRNELSLFRRNNIGMVFQDFNLISSLSIKENILVPLILDKKYEIIQGDSVDKLAKLLDIEEIMNKYPYEISGGQQQRAAICRAIINSPKIIFADEPTGNLDSSSSEKVLEYFKLLHSEYNTSIVMVTHDIFSASYCDRVVFLKDGVIIKEIIKKKDRFEFFNCIMKEVQAFSMIDKRRKSNEV
ncbi:ABC transporter ATP-binding protein [Clostridium felsineum]|uniref:ABC transporter ATP-binding protein n=1 Tax=Clostridium felsineum TaxID=36839 RepID=UPI00214DC02E|nr:ABC transporter ATP-binding protein [Clostridium felsineum]MCR3758923.1 ABC transporter ATP-binding protein [Clostridium felsineum]